MAEKYGTVPKKFTKAWWEYFWMYYKWHTIAIGFAIILVAVTVYQSVTAPKYDLTLTYAGENYYSDEVSRMLTDTLSPLCEDIDENGECSLYFSQLNLGNVDTDPEYAMAMNTKLQLAFAEDEAYIFILDEETASAYAGEAADDCVFAPLDDWLETDIGDKKTFSAHGKNYGIELSECVVFKDTGADFSNQYLFIRYYPRKDQMKEQLDGYNAAIKLANEVLTK